MNGVYLVRNYQREREREYVCVRACVCVLLKQSIPNFRLMIGIMKI
jgi:hypothetical protein